MTLLRRRNIRLSTADVSVVTDSCHDRGVGIVVQRAPLTLLLPLHLVVAFEDEANPRLSVNGVFYSRIRFLFAPELERDQLALVRVRGRKRSSLGSIRIPQRAVRLKPGQAIELGGLQREGISLRTGKVVEIKERAHGTTVITDVEVQPGDSGSALISNRQLVAVCQGMLPNGNGGVAIAIPLTTESLRRLWGIKLRTLFWRFLPLGFLGVAVAALIVLGVLQAGSLWRANPSSMSITPDDTGGAPAYDFSYSESTNLPMMESLFSSGINYDENVASESGARVSARVIDGETTPTFTWEIADSESADVSYDLPEPIGDGGVGVAITVSAAVATSIRVQAVWAVDGCEPAYRWLEAEIVLHASPEPQRHVLPYETFILDPFDWDCSDQALDPDWEKLVALSFWPESTRGELRFHRIELLRQEPIETESGERYLVDPEQDNVSMQRQAIDGFSPGSVPISWWYTSKLEAEGISFVDCRPGWLDNRMMGVAFHYPEMSSSRTLVLQMHEYLRPVDFSCYEGLEIACRADESTECYLAINLLDPALPSPHGDPPETPGGNITHLPEPLIVEPQERVFRIPFSDFELESWVRLQYPDSLSEFDASALGEVWFEMNDAEGWVEILSVNLYR